MTAQPLRILLVAADRGILRQLSKFLDTFGYETGQIADWQRACDALDGARPDVLIVDSEPDIRAALEFCSAAETRLLHRRPRKLLLVEQPGPQILTEALGSGVDDFLSRPVVYGQLLSRLRSAARSLEFERRVRRQASIDPLTHLFSRTLFYDEIRSKLAGDAADRPTAACVLIDLDGLDRLGHVDGQRAVDRVVQATAAKLVDLCRDADLLASFGNGRFCAWLGMTSADEATAWAESVRSGLASVEVALRETTVRAGASIGISEVLPGPRTPEEIVDCAAAAVRTAKTSGGDCVVRYSEFDGEAEAWTGFAAPGKLFERTVARDVMTPCTQTLQREDTVARAAETFRRTDAGALPVVEPDGKFAGALFPGSILSGPRGAEMEGMAIDSLLTTDIPTYDEQAGFAELRDFFTRDSRSLILIVHKGRPTGFVTPDSLAALSEPLTSESFATAGPYDGSSSYLRVPDLSPLAP
ncbi:MAG: diguanylate cyclase [Candidatus Nealsonbacteria bacterium]|nr:diguanylate cyclase [Candidatus Nealsonbacteria bacterium]